MHILNWLILVLILAFIATGKFRIELVALTGLFILGMAGFSEPRVIFLGYRHPALITIISIFVVSQAIIKSEALRGLGQLIGKKVSGLQGQILGLSLFSSILSAFMNNVGAVGLLLPTAVRMADRKQIERSSFGLPLALASVIGGSLTLIGSAPNIIAASYMYSATGQSFQMFDFTYHGAAMLFTGVVLWLVLSKIGYEGTKVKIISDKSDAVNTDVQEQIKFAPINHPKKRITIFVVFIAILTVSSGILHPALGFGAAGLVLIFGRVISPSEAYQAIDLRIVIFLGAMLGIGEILENTSSIGLLSDLLIANVPAFNPLLLIILLILISSALSNGINNSAAAVFMAPLSAAFAEQTDLETAAALMAIAAGSNLTLLLPTHQAVLMVQSKAPFSPKVFMKVGILFTLFLSLAAGVVINMVWQ